MRTWQAVGIIHTLYASLYIRQQLIINTTFGQIYILLIQNKQISMKLTFKDGEENLQIIEAREQRDNSIFKDQYAHADRIFDELIIWVLQ